jgi:hypothetical protein
MCTALPRLETLVDDDTVYCLVTLGTHESGGSGEGLAAEWRGHTLSRMGGRVLEVLRLSQSACGAREIVQAVGQPAVERVVSNLLPLLNEPMLRIALRGDVRKLLSELLSALDALLRAAANEDLPADQRAAAFSFGVADLFEAAYSYLQDVFVSSGVQSELHDMLQWLLHSWHHAQRRLDLDALRGELSWDRLLAMLHKARIEGKEHGKLTAAELDAMLPTFVRALRGL